jgi:hypothetical protein
MQNVIILKNLPETGLCGRCLSLWGPEPRTSPLICCIRVSVYLFTQGKGGGGRLEPKRRGEGQQFTKLGRKYQHDWLYLQSLNSEKTPTAKSLYRSNFLMSTICFGDYIVNYSMLSPYHTLPAFQCLIADYSQPQSDNFGKFLRWTKAEFLDVIGTKVLRVFLLAIHSHLY